MGVSIWVSWVSRGAIGAIELSKLALIIRSIFQARTSGFDDAGEGLFAKKSLKQVVGCCIIFKDILSSIIDHNHNH